MKELTPDESKRLSLDILIRVADFCDQHGIKYSLAYGTLIGAIRHKGFIPWDDDIDIIMMRDDYERFVSLYHDDRYHIVGEEKQLNHLHVRVANSATLVDYPKDSIIGKFYKDGLWVDVFPIDKVPDTLRGFRRQKWMVTLFLKMQQLGEMGGRNTQLKNLGHIILKPFSKFFGKLAQKGMVYYHQKKTQTVANLAVYYLNFPQFPMSYMDEFVEVEFEGKTFKAVKEYDAFLRGIYGDYMQFPPEEKRVAHHFFKAYLKD